jgi:hypothetical protein
VEDADLDRALGGLHLRSDRQAGERSAADVANRFRTVLRCMDFPVSMD